MFIERAVVKASALNLRSLQIYVSATLLCSKEYKSERKRALEINISFSTEKRSEKYPGRLPSYFLLFSMPLPSTQAPR